MTVESINRVPQSLIGLGSCCKMLQVVLVHININLIQSFVYYNEVISSANQCAHLDRIFSDFHHSTRVSRIMREETDLGRKASRNRGWLW